MTFTTDEPSSQEKFTLYGTTDGGANAYAEIFVSVCGNEAVTSTYGAEKWIPTLVGTVPPEYFTTSFFSVSDSDCPFKTYTAYQDAAMTQVWTDTKFSIDPDNDKLIIDYSIIDSYSVYLKAVTIGLKTNSVELKIYICEDPSTGYTGGLPGIVALKYQPGSNRTFQFDDYASNSPECFTAPKYDYTDMVNCDC